MRALAASDRARRQLLADVSHELMTPLAAIRGYTETLAMPEVTFDAETRTRYLGIIGDETQDGANGQNTGKYYILKDGPIKTVKDLKGGVLASVGPGTAVDISMRAMMKKNGMEEKRDYTMVTAAFPAMKAMLLEKKAQLVASVQPFEGDAEFQEKARPLFTNVEALDGPSIGRRM